jgi:L-aspartate oxidase
MQTEVDFLIIGSGIAGLSYALKVADHGKVMLVTKSNADESNTKYAQGGIAAVLNSDDSFDKHIQDTLIAGDGLCDTEVVNVVVTEGTARVSELIAWGADFDKSTDGSYDLAREGGHSEHRILHHKDVTGLEIERALLAKVHAHANISLYTHLFAIDIITDHHLGAEITSQSENITCYGAYLLNTLTGKVQTVLARITLMATGGAGHVYKTTTNPTIATGDGVAMVYRAKGAVSGMEFIQFHPTALYNPGEHPCFLISEAVRGMGAVLRTKDGQEFMQLYDERKSLASRDIVARAIDNEMKKSGSDYVYLDARQLPFDEFKTHFPNIYAKCKNLGIDITINLIPVVPACHYMCGGIKVNLNACSTIHNLFAVGECASTGLHGANRLASNSLLEAVVFAHRAALHSISLLKSISFQKDVPPWNAEGTTQPNELVLITQNLKELQSLMSNYVGIVRTDQRLKRALDRLRIIYGETEALYERSIITQQLCELRNLITIAYLIVKSAMARKENVGLHFNSDNIKAPGNAK